MDPIMRFYYGTVSREISNLFKQDPEQSLHTIRYNIRVFNSRRLIHYARIHRGIGISRVLFLFVSKSIIHFSFGSSEFARFLSPQNRRTKFNIA